MLAPQPSEGPQVCAIVGQSQKGEDQQPSPDHPESLIEVVWLQSDAN